MAHRQMTLLVGSAVILAVAGALAVWCAAPSGPTANAAAEALKEQAKDREFTQGIAAAVKPSLRGDAATQPATMALKVKAQDFVMEIAATPETREHGLMDRDKMAADHGMIFVFEEPGVYPFWMHNTRIPLDIIWLGAGGKVVHIETMQPFDENARDPRRVASYVIELNAGTAEKLGLKLGDRVELAKDPLKPAPATTENKP